MAKKGTDSGNKAYARITASKATKGASTKGSSFKRDFAKKGTPAPSSWGACGSSAS